MLDNAFRCLAIPLSAFILICLIDSPASLQGFEKSSSVTGIWWRCISSFVHLQPHPLQASRLQYTPAILILETFHMEKSPKIMT
jgi:hypothetical protein